MPWDVQADNTTNAHSVALHEHLGRSVVEYSALFANKPRLEQHFRATEPFGGDSENVPRSQVLCLSGPSPAPGGSRPFVVPFGYLEPCRCVTMGKGDLDRSLHLSNPSHLSRRHYGHNCCLCHVQPEHTAEHLHVASSRSFHRHVLVTLEVPS